MTERTAKLPLEWLERLRPRAFGKVFPGEDSHLQTGVLWLGIVLIRLGGHALWRAFPIPSWSLQPLQHLFPRASHELQCISWQVCTCKFPIYHKALMGLYVHVWKAAALAEHSWVV